MASSYVTWWNSRAACGEAGHPFLCRLGKYCRRYFFRKEFRAGSQLISLF